MTRNTRLITSLFVCFAIFGLSTTASAEPGQKMKRGHDRGDRFIEVVTKNADALKLDANTLAVIKEIHEDAKEERSAIRAALVDSEKSLRGLMKSEKPDHDTIMAKIDQIGAMRTDLHKVRVRTMLETKAVLSKEQQETLKKLLPPKRARRGGEKMRSRGDKMRSRSGKRNSGKMAK